MPRLQERYRNEIVPALMKEFSYPSVMRCRASRRWCSTSAWARRCRTPRRWMPPAGDMTIIAGQKPVITKAKKLHRQLQAARRQLHRRDGDAARRAHVELPGSPDEHCAAPAA